MPDNELLAAVREEVGEEGVPLGVGEGAEGLGWGEAGEGHGGKCSTDRVKIGIYSLGDRGREGGWSSALLRAWAGR